ncbi:retinitis pigmentosa 1-like 1 protein isoform X2 [Denticeps clupeoides]|uniref:retinitis pigmentosa 1-like 1 protein isoform X2 n=1 Tax=Denticeps clupeoides TaxID=299321 RepID=UPI0010A3AEC9|nr:retinitis pigmentosa 1-like 1 protein isoform X2 [Denticeps clupeoides]
MAAHKRVFHCFDAIADDHFHRAPRSNRHRSVISQHGSHGTTAQLEPLEDRGCYVCSDHRSAPPSEIEAAAAQASPWYQAGSHQHVHKKPTRPEEPPGEHSHQHEHHYHRHSKRIMLIKNSDPSFRKTITLHHKSLRSLGVFVDEVSELMQSHVRKLYTLEGRKIDSIQSLLQCPSVLVCVGREPFHPVLLEYFQKNSDEKLPRLRTKSRTNLWDGQETKKNVNFGLETKKSIIHPRFESNNRAARLSMSSEKSFSNGLRSQAYPGPCPHTRHSMMDDDIEKRVLVNKDGSLSMEMKVRFRLLNDETLHWSTEIKKSAGTVHESFLGRDESCFIQHGSAESCSESAGEAEDVYTKFHQRHMEEPHCSNCCSHCQEYDIWKNPIIGEHEAVRHIRSSSSSASSRILVCKKASVDSVRTMSCSSEEYTERVVGKATCIQQTVEEGKTVVGYVNHCCNCNGEAKTKSLTCTGKKGDGLDNIESACVFENDKSRASCNSDSAHTSKDTKEDTVSVQITQVSQDEDRPISIMSNSSQVLATLKEDHDDDEEDLPPSVSRAFSQNESNFSEDDVSIGSAIPSSCSGVIYKVCPTQYLSPRPHSKTSGCSGVSAKSVKPEAPAADEGEGIERSSEKGNRPSLSTSEKTSRSSKYKSVGTGGAVQPPSDLDAGQDDEKENITEDVNTDDRAMSSMSAKSINMNEDDKSEEGADRPSSAMSAKSSASKQSRRSEVSDVGEEKNAMEQEPRAPSAMSAKSQTSTGSRDPVKSKMGKRRKTTGRPSSAMSAKSDRSINSEGAKGQPNQNEAPQSETEAAILQKTEEEPRALSAMSAKSVRSNVSSTSKNDPKEADREDGSVSMTEDRPASAMSDNSHVSERSKTSAVSEIIVDETVEVFDQTVGRVQSAMSAKSDFSTKSKKSTISKGAPEEAQDRAASALSTKSKKSRADPEEERSHSALSVKTNASEKSTRSTFSEHEHSKMNNKELTEERTESAMSVKSNVSRKSKKSVISEEARDERSPSAMSAKSNARSKTPNTSEITAEEWTEERTQSAMSTKSAASARAVKALEAEPEDAEVQESTENRMASPMSNKSNVSNQSNKSNMFQHAIEECPDKGEETEDRAPSALSTRSNISAISERSEKITVDEVGVEQSEDRSYISESASGEKEDAEEICEHRTASSMSAKSNVSTKSKASKISETGVFNNNVENASEHTDDRAQSALSGKSDVSARSRKSAFSEAAHEETADTEEKADARAASTMSAKSNASDRSKKSHVTESRAQSTCSIKSTVSGKPMNSKVLEDEDISKEEMEQRGTSAMSIKSNESSRSKKSKCSKCSVAVTDETSDTEKLLDITADNTSVREKPEDRAQSPLSAKSNTSARVTPSKIPEKNVDETSDLELTDGRSPSVLSALSNVSSGSKKSNVPEIITDIQPTEERAQSSRSTIKLDTGRKCVNTDNMTDDRTESPMSDMSTRSKKSNISDIALEEQTIRAQSKMSAQSNLSVRSKTSVLSGGTPRVQSTMSTKSNISAKSKKSNALETEERAPSSKSVKSNVSAISIISHTPEVEPIEVIRTLSPMSARSDGSVRSKTSKISDMDLTGTAEKPEQSGEIAFGTLTDKSNLSVRPKKYTVSNAEDTEDVEDNPAGGRATSTLSIKSDTSTRIPSCMSDKSHVSTASKKSNASLKSKATQTSNIDVKNKKIKKSSKPVTPISLFSDNDIISAEDMNERPASAQSLKSTPSNINSAERVLTPASSASVSLGLANDHDENDGEQNISNHRPSSKTSKASTYSKKAANGNVQCNNLDADSNYDVKSNKSYNICSKCSHKFKKSTSKENVNARAQSNLSQCSSQLEGTDDNSCLKSNQASDESRKKADEDKSMRPSSAEVTSEKQLSSIPTKGSQRNVKNPIIRLDGSTYSNSSQSGIHHPKEPTNSRTVSVETKSNISDKTCSGLLNANNRRNVSKSGKSKSRKDSSSSQPQADDDFSQMVPSNLPNTSPTEVVNEWLKRIPSDNSLYDAADEFHEHCNETEPSEESHMPLQTEEKYEARDIDKIDDSTSAKEEFQEANAQDSVMVNNDLLVEDLGEVDPKKPAEPCTSPHRKEESKELNSSVQVMKVLLSPKLDRCNSLPEVSPVYGRKLSTSARGLLDCLANLQLIDFDPTDQSAKQARYKELMDILKSLWLCDPFESEPKIRQTEEIKEQHSMDYDFNHRSSSGVDVSSGSAGSGKSSLNGNNQMQNSQAMSNSAATGLDALSNLKEVDEEEHAEASVTEVTKSDPATSDTASQVQGTPEKVSEGTDEEKQKDQEVPPSDETIRSNDSPRVITDTPPSSNKSSGNESNRKTLETETEHQEETSSGTPPSVQRVQLAKKVSQDPDPVWVLNLLNKLQKQFMTHYVNAMAEFKVRWNLEDNEQLDTMINELQNEVHKRIQSSIDRELTKIQGRAGRPRPPKDGMSRESTVQTEQRRRRLKVMRNQSIDAHRTHSDEDYTATGTDFSDQRSDDEYCPCDTCMKKKMVSGSVLPTEIFNTAPVMMDFDLRKILQLKRELPLTVKAGIIEETESEIKSKEDESQEKLEERDKDSKVEPGRVSDGQGEAEESDGVQVETAHSEIQEAEETGEGEEVEENVCSEMADEETEQQETLTVDEGGSNKEHDPAEVEQTLKRSDDAEIDDESAQDETANKSESCEEEEAKQAAGENTEQEKTADEEEADKEETDQADTAEGEKSQDEDETGQDETSNEEETEQAETVDEEKTQDEMTNEEEAESAKNEQSRDETANEEETNEPESHEVETVQAESDEEETAQAESDEEETPQAESNEEETAQAESNEEETPQAESNEEETAQDDTSNEEETAQAESNEEETAQAESNEEETAQAESNEEETAQDDTTNEEETAQDDTTNEEETAHVESNEEETAQVAEDGNVDEGGLSKEEGEADNKTEKNGETAEDEDEGTEEHETGEGETADDNEANEEVNVEPHSNMETEDQDDVLDISAEEDEPVTKQGVGEKNISVIDEEIFADEDEKGQDGLDRLKANESTETANEDDRVGNLGASADGEDEAEDETELDIETDDGEAEKINSIEERNDETRIYEETSITSLESKVKANIETSDGADADVEDSETDFHNKMGRIRTGPESTSKQEESSQPQWKGKSAKKTFKKLVDILTFLRLTAVEKPGNEDSLEGEDVDEDIEKNGTSTGNSDEDGSASTLRKQVSNSSLESQPGSFEEFFQQEAKVKKQAVSSKDISKQIRKIKR